MSAMLQVLALWIPVSCVICPFFTWQSSVPSAEFNRNPRL
jgi:hypothetical protein